MPFLQKKGITVNNELHTFTHYGLSKASDENYRCICTPCLFPTLNNYFVHFTLIIIKKDMYPFTKYLKFLIKDVKIVWARSMKGISSPPPGTVDRDRRNTPHARTAMSIFSLRLAAIDCLGAIWWRLVM